MERFIAFDVETPNHRNDRISAIGITVVEGGEIVEEYSTLVDPECEFDYFNVALTGITSEMVIGKPNFAQLWEEIGDVMQSGVLVAHNAAFDMAVLSKCLRRYDAAFPPYADYLCTVHMGRRVHPELPNHKLDTLCAWLGIPLDHHEPLSDSRACARLLVDYVNCGADIAQYLRRYDLLHARTLSYKR